MLNKILFAIKTDMRSHTSAGVKNQWTDHKYTADEDLLPQEKRRLNSLQWKMTNKVANDYISLLLGWSRERVMYKDEKGMEPVNPLKEDSGFGKSMANKALGNRGILGRLKQKIFSGQQSNNVISVVFQLDDPNDYTIQERPSDGNEINTTTIQEKPTGDEKTTNESTCNESSINSFGFTIRLDDDAMMRLLEESIMEDSVVADEICEGVSSIG